MPYLSISENVTDIYVFLPIIKIVFNVISVTLLIVEVVISRGPEFLYLFKFKGVYVIPH